MSAKVVPLKSTPVVGEPLWTAYVPVAFVVRARDEAQALERIESLCKQDEQSWASDDERAPMLTHVSPPPWLKRIALVASQVDGSRVDDGEPEEDPLAAYADGRDGDEGTEHDEEITDDEVSAASTAPASLFDDDDRDEEWDDDDA